MNYLLLLKNSLALIFEAQCSTPCVNSAYFFNFVKLMSTFKEHSSFFNQAIVYYIYHVRDTYLSMTYS